VPLALNPENVVPEGISNIPVGLSLDVIVTVTSALGDFIDPGV
jgi:hypothetical protein